MPSAPVITRLLRASVLGLGTGCGVGAIALGVTALRPLTGCDGRSEAECAFERQSAAELSHYQLLFAVGLVALAAAIFVWLWSRRSAGRVKTLHR